MMPNDGYGPSDTAPDCEKVVGSEVRHPQFTFLIPTSHVKAD